MVLKEPKTSREAPHGHANRAAADVGETLKETKLRGWIV
jgi:hypothetical protein